MHNFRQRCQEYVEFTRTTACYPRSIELEYLVTGLSDEAIEFYLEPADSRNKLKELGDVMWYAARLCDELATDGTRDVVEGKEYLTFREVAAYAYVYTHSWDDEDVILCEKHILKASGKILGLLKRVFRGDLTDVIEIEQRVREQLSLVVRSAMLYAMHHSKTQAAPNIEQWLDVLHMNQEKLQSRLERGAIKGEGDER